MTRRLRKTPAKKARDAYTRPTRFRAAWSFDRSGVCINSNSFEKTEITA